MQYDSSFWLAVITLLIGLLVFMLRTIFASKCRVVHLFWGCLKIDRDVDIEMRDIRQSPERNNSMRFHPPIIRSQPNSRSGSPVSVVDIAKLDLERNEM
jgi:hypothetical protein